MHGGTEIEIEIETEVGAEAIAATIAWLVDFETAPTEPVLLPDLVCAVLESETARTHPLMTFRRHSDGTYIWHGGLTAPDDISSLL